MIKFSLKCAKGHRFDSWFQSASAYDKLADHAMISCAICGDSDIEKTLMAPSVVASRTQRPQPSDSPAPARAPGALSTPASAAEQALAEIRRKIEQNSEYVGRDFVREARQMHEGDAPERAIYGEARLDEASKLIEEGVPVMPLPFRPNRKVN